MRRFEGRRVLFVLPSNARSGGTNIVLLEAEATRGLGVDAWIANLDAHRRSFESCYPDLQLPVRYLRTPEDLAATAEAFDAVVATLYLSVPWLAPLRGLAAPPVLGYYIQDFEPDFFPRDSDDYRSALSSYTAVPELRRFAKTLWTRNQVEQKVGVPVEVIGPSFDPDHFHPSPFAAMEGAPLRILAMVRPTTPRRAPEATMRILERVSERFGDAVRIVVFGVSASDPEFLGYPRDFPHECLGEVTSEEVAEALAAADIFVDCSTFQAMGLTAMEAMASGVAVVGPENGGLREIVTHGRDGLLVDTLNEDAVVAAVARLVSDHALRRSIRANALEVVRHSPTLAACRMLDCLFGEAQAGRPAHV
jgi:glycosyltransferase involved in cell wall biosynthesis